MEFERLAIPDVVLIRPRAFADARGWFFESFNRRRFAEMVGLEPDFVQDNHSRSAARVLRGLHHQLAPHAQGKLVRAVRGSVFDVAVDIRHGSETFGRWVAATLSADGREQLWIPPGFAHGFLALTDGAEVHYKTTAPWHAAAERSIAWNDPAIGIAWPLDGPPILSEKDAAAPRLSATEVEGHRT